MKIVQQSLSLNSSHTLFHLKTLQRDEPVAFDIYIKKDGGYLVIIEAGTLVTSKIYEFLQKQKALYVLRADRNKKSLTCANIYEHITFNKDLNEKNIRFLYEVNETQFVTLQESKSNKLNMNCINALVKSIVYLIKHNKSYLKEVIGHFSNEYRLDIHTLHVAIYAVHLGYYLKSSEKELVELGTAGLLHDIGFVKVDEKILNKNIELDADELALVQKHTRYGVEIAEHNQVHDSLVLDAIMHHHERYDGSGYPHKYQSQQIKKHASIIAICDVFDALTNNRPYRKKFTYFEALKFMIKDPSMQDKFNSKYLQVFLKSLI